MCGFVGFTGDIPRKDLVLRGMADRIVHRGPDMGGFYSDESISLAFRRLSILDLSEAGNQPFRDEGRDVALVYNGEIYNFEQIRSGLEEKGYVFSTRCDSEVLLYACVEYGRDVVSRLRGMFAFAFWDGKKGELFCARDYFGIKPFYYTLLPGGRILFGSEIKSFLEHPDFEKKVNPRVLSSYLTFQYSATDETFFDGVNKLPPAHTLVWKDGKIEISPYWDVAFQAEDPKNKSLEAFAEELDGVINESVRAHKISDVEVGSFLSGGIDSSYITSALRPDKTFSVGFGDKKFNETAHAEKLSEILGIKHFTRILDPDECFAAFPDIQYHMDEPQSNPSVVPLWFLAKLASEHVKVVLSGEGADEIFAGYEWYDETPLTRKYKKLPAALRRGIASLSAKLPYFKGHDFLIRASGRPEDYFIGQAYIYSPKEASAVLREKYRGGKTVNEIVSRFYKNVSGKDELTKKQYLDLKQWLPGDILLKADKMSMAFSLELRVPFLDREVMAFAQTIPSSYKINGIDTKYVLRLASAKTLPEEWVNRKKMGFPVPIRLWLREEKYKNIVRSYFDADFSGEFFEREKLDALLEEHYSGKRNNGRKIWTVFTFLVWYKRFFIDDVLLTKEKEGAEGAGT